MANELTVFQAKALSLREYLDKPAIKNQMQSALPRWLTVDRLYRVLHSAVMKNPKIVDCTRESILSAVMQCAQLGLEPILGRAYLIPYENSKKGDDGRWIKLLELQMQIGYQGLVDLARRSDTISDVWGENVYQNDEFHIEFGMHRDLRHRPWYMIGQSEAGYVIGAYVVWKLKDGSLHPEFMPISEIHKRRAKSQSYVYAETGSGKKNSVWHEWPEEMNLKTVIKHSSKLIPASIEFMQAIEMDTDGERIAGAQMGVGIFDGTVSLPAAGDGPQGDAGKKMIESAPDLATRFRAVLAEWSRDPKLDDFVKATARGNGVAVSSIMESAIDDVVKFVAAFKAWKAKLPKDAGAGQQAGAGAATTSAANGKAPGKEAGAELDATAFINEWLRLHGANYEKYVIDNLDRFDKYAPWVLKKAQDKFEDKVGKPWPSKIKSSDAIAQGQQETTKGTVNDKAGAEIVQPGANGAVLIEQSDEWNELMMLKGRYPDIYARDIGNSEFHSIASVNFAIKIMSESVAKEAGGSGGIPDGSVDEFGDDIPY